MKEITKLMDIVSNHSIPYILLCAASLIVCQNVATLLLYPTSVFEHELQVIIVPFLLIFLMMNRIHMKRLRSIAGDGTLTRLKLLPAKNSSFWMSELVITGASYALLIVAQYASWMLLYLQMKHSFPVYQETFFFFALHDAWLSPLMMLHLENVAVFLFVFVSATLCFTMLHISFTLKQYRGFSILLTSVVSLAVISISIFNSMLPTMLVGLLLVDVFVIVETMDMLDIRARRKQP